MGKFGNKRSFRGPVIAIGFADPNIKDRRCNRSKWPGA